MHRERVVPAAPDDLWARCRLMRSDHHPKIIQGGMGAGVSTWRLARVVSRAGQLGVVSGTALDLILARRLQLGDPGEHMRRGLEAFPYPEMADRILSRYFIPGGKAPGAPFRSKPAPALRPNRHLLELTVTSNFVEVWLAKEGHDGLVGINYLEKIQLPTLPSIFGAMLAGVDRVLMGAGIPRFIPGILDGLSKGEAVELPIAVDRNGSGAMAHFDPADFCGGEAPSLSRPLFLAIVASAPLATMLAKKATGFVDGFIVEGPTAGGHNAPPRGKLRLSESGEPVYGERDVADLETIAGLGRPFWLAGSYGRPGRLADALATGATGVQVGTSFAFCEESGIAPDVKRRVIDMVLSGPARVRTDAVASPTGFPFKMAEVDGSFTDPKVAKERSRICDLSYLRHAYEKEDGSIGWRCPSEPEKDYERKGGELDDTKGRLCVCNGLMATIGMGQTRPSGEQEPPMVTSGDDLPRIKMYLKDGATSYRAQDVLEVLLKEPVELAPVAAPGTVPDP
jgi:nitronate monooxygenase